MKLRTIAGYIAIIAVTIIGAELLARVYDWSPGALDWSTGDRLGVSRYYPSATGAGDLVPHQNGHWIIWYHRPYHVETNSAGMRNTEEPSEKAFRIVALGDSQTFGPYLANEDTWPAWTENHLRRHFKDPKRVQVFNGGIAGYTIYDELALLREKVVAFKPKLVVLGVFENDLTDLRRERKTGIGMRPADSTLNRAQTLLKVIARSSALVTLAQQVKSRMQLEAAGVNVLRGEGNIITPSGRPDDYDMLAERYGELFRETVRLVRSNGIGLAVIYIPGPHALNDPTKTFEMEKLIRTLTTEEKVPYLDVSDAMRAENDPATDLYLMQRDPRTGELAGNGHLSRQGNAVIGRTLAKWLREQNLIGP